MENPTTTSLTLPTAGIGGDLYDTSFIVPVYPASPNKYVTWRMLDTWNTNNIDLAATHGLATGLVWATLTYLLALTPNRKRTTAFHSFMLLGLVFILVQMMIDMATLVTPGEQTLSAYTSLTFDIVDNVWPAKVVVMAATSEVASWLAFLFAIMCLWLQSKGLMTGLKSRRPGFYRFVLSYLIITSLVAFAAAVAYGVHNILAIDSPITDVYFSLVEGYSLRVAFLASHAICIGSYSLVSIVSVVDIVWKRPKTVAGGGAYASALNLVGLLCAQSFIIPFIFCILSILPTGNDFLYPQLLLLPSVYLILPLGSLFMTVQSNTLPNGQNRSPLRVPVLSPAQCDSPGKATYADSDMTLTSNRAESPPSSHLLDGAHIDQELQRIDAMECGDSVISRRTPKVSGSELHDRDSQEKEVVVMEHMVK